MIRVPVIGQVSAGSPIEWIPIEKWRTIRPLKDAPCGGQLYGMDVVGKSLIGKHILPGDVLIFVYGSQAKPGDLCVIQTPHGLTAKFIFPSADGDEVVLKAANVLVKDQVWPCDSVKILGVVKRVERDI